MRAFALKYKNERLKKMYQNSTIVSTGIPLNYSLFSSSQYIALVHSFMCLHTKKETKNLWGWSFKSLIGGGHNFITSMRRSYQDNLRGKNS